MKRLATWSLLWYYYQKNSEDYKMQSTHMSTWTSKQFKNKSNMYKKIPFNCFHYFLQSFFIQFIIPMTITFKVWTNNEPMSFFKLMCISWSNSWTNQHRKFWSCFENFMKVIWISLRIFFLSKTFYNC